METFSALLAICAGNSPIPGEFPAQSPVTWGFDVFFDLRPNKRVSKQSWGWWFQTLSRPLWRHCNGSNLFVSLHNAVCNIAVFPCKYLNNWLLVLLTRPTSRIRRAPKSMKTSCIKKETFDMCRLLDFSSLIGIWVSGVLKIPSSNFKWDCGLCCQAFHANMP